MITHTLWHEKPRLSVITHAPIQQQPSYYHRPRQPEITSQTELDAYWAQRPLPKLPVFIKWRSNRTLTDPRTDLPAVGVIIGTCTVFEALETNYAKEPLTICMFNCSQYAQLSSRWEVLDDWLPITQDEYDLIVKPNYDSISAKIQHWTEHEKERITRSTKQQPQQSGQNDSQSGSVSQNT